MASSSQTGSAGSAISWKYDVFLSFRGTDTRKGFTDYLHDRLQWQGIKTFRDDPQLERGTTINSELLTAIEQSRFAIVVLSPNYATSTWCLLELSKIVECMEERGTILPIFYEVEPSHVRHQRGSFAEAFEVHEEKFGEGNKEVERWRSALTKVASLAGWSSNNYRYETELIREIVQELWRKVHPSLTVFGSSEKLVGMDTKLKKIEVLLDKEANDVRFIGIWGMGGLGKTTLAKLVYEKMSHQFEVCIFLADVREVSSTTQGLIYLQKQILSQTLKVENVQVWNVYNGITMIKRCCSNKAVLLVLDDVDQSKQLENLAGKEDWFGSRSRIIITTRDQRVLVRRVENPYELKGLNENEALELFSWNAFWKDEPEEDYAEQSKSFVRYAGGLPLALTTLGSLLYKRSPDAWNSALAKLHNTPDRTIFDLLKVSYDGLDEKEKETFLDITCFSSRFGTKFITELLYSSDICTRIAIDVLVEKSLLTISSGNEIGIHDLIREMGREIVRQESYEEPGRRSRLWLRGDIFHVFTQNTGTEAVEGIMLDLDRLENADWNLEALSKMHKLRLLYICNLRLSHGPKHLPNALRFLRWSWYPSKSLPPCFQPDELTDLILVHSSIDHLWNGIKNLGKLKSIDLRHSINLTRTPDFTGIPNLEKLVLEGCTNLVEIHPSIALLKRLKIWNFRNCKSIKSLPDEVHMEFLETFDISGCSKLKMIPEFVGQTKRLSKVSFGGTCIEKLPSSVEHLRESLMDLDLSGIVIREQPYSRLISSFGFFPRKSTPHPLIPLLTSLKHFTCLWRLNLNDCNLCEGEIPNDIGSLSSLEFLDLRGNNFVSLPASIHSLSKLYYFNVGNCKMLQKLPDLPDLQKCHLFVGADNCTSLQVSPGAPGLCGSHYLSCINCFNIVGYPDSSHFVYSVLKRLLEVLSREEMIPPLDFEDFQEAFERGENFEFKFVIPGSEIPEGFSKHIVGDSVTKKLPSVTVKLPSVASNSEIIGIVTCVLISPEENLSAVPVDPSIDFDFDPGTCLITTLRRVNEYGKFERFPMKQIDSDHLLIVVDFDLTHLYEESYDEVTFEFEITRAVGSNWCLKVKKFGVRLLYEHDKEELIWRINQSKGSISLYEATDEQEGAMVGGKNKRKRWF